MSLFSTSLCPIRLAIAYSLADHAPPCTSLPETIVTTISFCCPTTIRFASYQFQTAPPSPIAVCAIDCICSRSPVPRPSSTLPPHARQPIRPTLTPHYLPPKQPISLPIIADLSLASHTPSLACLERQIRLPTSSPNFKR